MRKILWVSPMTQPFLTHPALVSLERAAIEAHAAGGDWERFWKDWEATIRRWTKTPRRYRVMRTCLYRLVAGMDRPAGGATTPGPNYRGNPGETAQTAPSALQMGMSKGDFSSERNPATDGF